MRIVVYLGPTLPLPEARALLPHARYLPPVAMGDVYATVRRRPPDCLAIIDGYFEQVAAVWHKELLFAIERGVRVFGAASMGALRAAELQAFGMIGVGQVFQAYRRGILADDDEVAVAHGPADYGYPRFSEAMVNVRDALERARRAKVISAAVASRLTALAKAQFYRDRGWDTVLEAGRAARLPARQLSALAAHLQRHRPDRKADDARMLLRRLARLSAAPGKLPAAPRLPEPLARTWFWRQLQEICQASR